jgi:hypothetical protein
MTNLEAIKLNEDLEAALEAWDVAEQNVHADIARVVPDQVQNVFGFRALLLAQDRVLTIYRELRSAR